MVEQLKKILAKALIEEKDVANFEQKNFLQYKTNDGSRITLNKKFLTLDQINLLNVFLTPIETEIKEYSSDQLFWMKVLFDHQENDGKLLKNSPYFQFTHFQLKELLHNQEQFEVALRNLFEDEVTVVWTSATAGMIIEYVEDFNRKLDESFKSLVEAIMADFYVQLYFFHGTPFSNLNESKNIYNWEQSALKIGKQVLPNHHVFEQELLIPYLLSSEVSELTSKMLLKTIELLREDRELLKTVKVFFECNLNTTLAAKKMFMHRNSLQYRIDKFIERTNLDIKQFPQAAAIYMLMAIDEMIN